MKKFALLIIFALSFFIGGVKAQGQRVRNANDVVRFAAEMATDRESLQASDCITHQFDADNRIIQFEIREYSALNQEYYTRVNARFTYDEQGNIMHYVVMTGNEEGATAYEEEYPITGLYTHYQVVNKQWYITGRKSYSEEDDTYFTDEYQFVDGEYKLKNRQVLCLR